MTTNFDAFKHCISYYNADSEFMHLPEVEKILNDSRGFCLEKLEQIRDNITHKGSKKENAEIGKTKTPPPKPPSLTQTLAENSLFGSNTRIQDVTQPSYPDGKNGWKDPSFDVYDFTIRSTLKNKKGDKRWRFWAGDRLKAEYQLNDGGIYHTGKLEHNLINGRTRANYSVSNPLYNYYVGLSNKDNVWDISAGYSNNKGFNIGASLDSEKKWAIALGYKHRSKVADVDMSAYIGSEPTELGFEKLPATVGFTGRIYLNNNKK